MSDNNWVVDAHLHLFRKDSQEYPRDCESFYPSEREALVEDYLEVMAANNVHNAVIVPLGTEIKYLTEILESYPEKFAGVAVLDYRSPDPYKDMRRWKQDIGIKGVRIMGKLGDPTANSFEDLSLASLLREMESLNLILWFYGSLDQLKLVHLVADALPNLTIVLNHLGFCQQGFSIDNFRRPHIEITLPPPSVAIAEALAGFKNIYVKLSGEYGFSHQGFPYLDIAPIAQRMLKVFGPKRLLWASDWPWIEVNPSYSSLISLTDIYFDSISVKDRQDIMGGNTKRLFGFK